jgi:hypothetical protein
VLNRVPLGPPADGRLPLDGLAAENVLTVESAVPDRGLTRFAEPSGGGDWSGGRKSTGPSARSGRVGASVG